MVASFAQKGDNIVFTIPKEFLGDDLVTKIKDYIHFLNLVQKSSLTPDEAIQLSESVKTEWWGKNRERILSKIQGT